MSSVSPHAMSRRYLAVWLPFLSDDRWRREATSRVETQRQDLRIFTVKVRGATYVAAVSRSASSLGLKRKMTLADARALFPGVHVLEHDVRADGAFLVALAEQALAFTPLVGFCRPHGLVLDITGCGHLFGDEVGLGQRLKLALETHGVSDVRMAIASTPDMARALARFASRAFSVAQDCSAVRALPVAAFECGLEDQRALERAGLRTVGDVASRPSVLFASRFGQAFTHKLSRLLGEEDRRISPYRPEPPLVLDHIMAEPVTSQAAIQDVVGSLFARAALALETRQEGGRVFTTTYFRADGDLRRVGVRTSLPTRDVHLLQRLHRDRMEQIADPLDPGFGFDLIRLEVDGVEPMALVQHTLDQRQEGDSKITHLADRLATIFGRARIFALEPVHSHCPERTQKHVFPYVSKPKESWPFVACDRPSHLFPTPQLIDVVEAEGGPMLGRFVWRRVCHRTLCADGPERISDEWWLEPSGFGARDYYDVRTTDGQRFWIFRAHATDASAAPQWFVHGVFS